MSLPYRYYEATGNVDRGWATNRIGYNAVSQQTTKDIAKRVLLSVRAKVLEGYPLSEALREYPRIFDSMYWPRYMPVSNPVFSI